MSVLSFDGFKTYADATDALSKYAVFDATLGTGRRAGSGSADLAAVGQIREDFSAMSSIARGFAYKQTALFATSILEFSTGAGEQISLRTTAGGQLYVSRNGTTLWTSGTNPTYRLRANAWIYLEFAAVINTSTGSWKLQVGGISLSLVEQSSVNTAGQGGTTADRAILRQSGAGASSFADIYLKSDTTLLGDQRVDIFLPMADGAHQDFSVYGESNMAAAIDDTVPNSGTDYIYAGQVDAMASVTLPNMAYTPSQISAVNIVHHSQISAVGTRSISAGLRISGSDYLNAAVDLTTSWTRYENLLLTNPATSNPFSQSDIDGLELVVKVVT